MIKCPAETRANSDSDHDIPLKNGLVDSIVVTLEEVHAWVSDKSDYRLAG